MFFDYCRNLMLTLTYPADHFFATDLVHFCHNMTFFVYQCGDKESYHLSTCHIISI